jgi:L-fuconolactonase
MRIDSHQHFWNFNAERDGWITDEMEIIRHDFLPQHLRPVLIRNNIEGTVAVQADQSEEETLFLLELARNDDFIKGVVGWVDLRNADLPGRLEYFRTFSALKGFRHIVQSEPKGFMSDSSFVNGVRQLGKYGFTYDLLIYHYQLEEALSFVNSIPDVPVVVDHIAKPSIRTGEKTHWELNMASLATFGNVTVKISGMVTEAIWSNWTKDQFYPYLDEILETFGPSRMMYGSDWPVCLLASSYEDQLGIVEEYIGRLSHTERELIMGLNAARFYKL